MDSLDLTVVPHGKRFVATSVLAGIWALGPSAEEATENARLVGIALFGKGPRPEMLIVRISPVFAPSSCSRWRSRLRSVA
jgi:hypothetical protein